MAFMIMIILYLVIISVVLGTSTWFRVYRKIIKDVVV